MVELLVLLAIGLPWLGAVVVRVTSDANPGRQNKLAVAAALAAAAAALALIPCRTEHSVLAVPLGALGLGPAGILNALCILVLAFSVFSLATLAVELGARPAPALLGAIAAGYGALTTVQLGFVSFTAVDRF